ncbi:MAG: DUF2911 domain-containing protein [Planctomycetota bacterium]
MRKSISFLVASLALAFTLPSLNAQQNQAQRSFPEKSQRGHARIFFWGGDSSAGQLAIDYGQPAWNEQHQKAIEDGRMDDKRWRLGQNSWTNLDTNIPLTIGGQKLTPGLYYMTLEMTSDGEYWLYFLDPKEIRKQKLDAFHAHLSKGGIEVLMEADELEKPTKQLEIELLTSGKQDRKASLEIRFGPFKWTAPIEMHPEES